jgi:hypothetical protein
VACGAQERAAERHGELSDAPGLGQRRGTEGQLAILCFAPPATRLPLRLPAQGMRVALFRGGAFSRATMAAGAESASVPVQVNQGPSGVELGLTGPLAAASTRDRESANGGQTRGSWPGLAGAGRSVPEHGARGEKMGPAGFEPAVTES